MGELRPVPPTPPPAERSARVGLTLVHGVLLLVWVSLQLRVIPTFEQMFAEFGAELPALTRLALSPLWPLAWASLDLVGPALGWLRPRVAPLLVTALLSGLGLLLTAVALYLPILALGKNIEP